MKPYVESGQAAQRRLNAPEPRQDPARRRALSNLRALKQVINTLGVSAIAVVPTVGLLTQSAAVAALTAGHFLFIICILELVERGVKRELSNLDAST